MVPKADEAHFLVWLNKPLLWVSGLTWVILGVRYLAQ